MTARRPSPKERVAARLVERFPLDEVVIDGAIVRVMRDGERRVSVVPVRRRFSLPGIVWPVQGVFDGPTGPEDLADAAADAVEAVAAIREHRDLGDALPGRERALARVQKLLALARDQRGKPEGETAARLALRVMAEAGVGVDAVCPVIQRVLGAVRPWSRRLWAACAEHVGAVLLEDLDLGGIVAFGTADQLDLAEFLHATISRGLLAEHADDGSLDADAFLVSAVAVVSGRLRAMRGRVRRSEPLACRSLARANANAAAWVAERLRIEPIERTPRLADIPGLPVAAGARAGRRVPIVPAMKQQEMSP